LLRTKATEFFFLTVVNTESYTGFYIKLSVVTINITNKVTIAERVAKPVIFIFILIFFFLQEALQIIKINA